MDRTEARAAAVKLIYEWEMGGDGGEETRLGLLQIQPGEHEADYMDALVNGVIANCAQLDEQIAAHADRWKLDRIAKVNLSILRVALYELNHTDLSPSIVINEALELARIYSSPESVPFVNGVLGAILRDREAEGEND